MSSQLKIPCLGRPFNLGMLYDCHSDRLIPGRTLWDAKVLQSALKKRALSSSSFEVIAEDTIRKKSLSLGIDGDLKLSLLGELVEVGGAAKFFNDEKSSEMQARVTLKYTTTTRFEQLTMEQLGTIQCPQVLNDNHATHVVTGITYGSDAFFVFDRLIGTNEKIRDIHVKMETQVKCIPNICGSLSPEVKGADKTETVKFRCNFYGDLILPSNPSTYDEAIKVYRELPQLISSNVSGDQSVPKIIYLYPLAELSGKPQQIIHSITSNLISQVEEFMESFHKIKMRANDLKNHDVCSKFVDIESQISTVISLCNRFKLDFVKKLSILLPKIRSCGADEKELAELISSVHKSPFNSDNLNAYLRNKSKEIKQLAQYIKNVSKQSQIQFDFPNSECDLIGLTTDVQIEHVLCFEVNVTSSSSTFIKNLEHFLATGETELIVDKEWFEQPEVLKNLRSKLANFTEFVQANSSSENTAFVVTDHNKDTDVSGPAIFCYTNGVPTDFDPPGQPGTPKAHNVTCNSVDLVWTEPKHGTASIVSYNILCQGNSEASSCTGNPKTSIRIESLSPGVEYHFQVQAVSEPGVSAVSNVITIRTESFIRLAECFLEQSKLIKRGNPSSYRLPLGQVYANQSDGLYKCAVGFSSASYKPEKVLMMVGATGAGKSTLINGMTNYILGVNWDDPFRFQVIFDEGSSSQAHSQTKNITAYTIHSTNLPYDLTIIDTPGFGDTGGIERDKFIASQIKKFFSESDRGGIDHLHGIGFVTQAPLARLTPTQKYIFHAVLSIFGKDIVDNIFLMVTFADANEPSVLEAVKSAEIPYKGSFKFNNSALFASNLCKTSDSQFNSLFWNMGCSSFDHFFEYFSRAESRSLALTREVLNEREQLETLIPGLQQQVKFGLNQLSEIEQEEKVLEQREAEIAANKEFTYTVEVAKFNKIPAPNATTSTCLTCNFTCHESCVYSNDRDKARCSAMRKGICTVCPGKCVWNVHCNLPYYFKQYTTTEVRTYQDLKARYETAKTGKAKVEAMKLKKEEALHNVQTYVYSLIERIRESLKRLSEIALKPNPLTEIEYLDLLIDSEQTGAKPGYQRRVAQYRKIRKDAEMLKKTAKLPLKKDPKSKGWWQFWR